MVSGPIMVMTQKITSLAFSLHDGRTKTEEEMKPSQKSLAIKETPNFLSYISYCLTFQTLMAGPSISYKSYIDFIEGKSNPASVDNIKVCNKNNSIDLIFYICH